MKAWLRFFRAVNLPTVPGDVLVGAAAVCAPRIAPALQLASLGGYSLASGRESASPLVAACVAGLFLYMFGLADNDIVGAKTDVGRPISDGEISLGAARWARGLCLFGALIVAAAANLPPMWWIAAFALAVAVVIYNRTKWCLLMGLCRGLNVWCGGVAMALCNFRGIPGEGRFALFCVTAVWTLYIAAVTKYSEGEERNAVKKRRVGFLIGAIVYLQLIALLIFRVNPLLLAGAALLVILRLLKHFLPEVSAS